MAGSQAGDHTQADSMLGHYISWLFFPLEWIVGVNKNTDSHKNHHSYDNSESTHKCPKSFFEVLIISVISAMTERKRQN